MILWGMLLSDSCKAKLRQFPSFTLLHRMTHFLNSSTWLLYLEFLNVSHSLMYWLGAFLLCLINGQKLLGICRHFRHSSSSLPILQQPICSFPLGTWVPKIGDSNGKPLAMLRPNASLNAALSLLVEGDPPFWLPYCAFIWFDYNSYYVSLRWLSLPPFSFHIMLWFGLMEPVTPCAGY